MIRASIFFLLLIVIPHANAQLLCQKTQGTVEMDECMKQELAKTESKLNSKYKKVIASLTRPDDEIQKYSISKKAVIEAQRAWVSYREKDCMADSTMLLPPDGTAVASLHMNCMIDYANIRIKKLDDFIIDF